MPILSSLNTPLSARRRRALAAINAVVGVNAVCGMAYALAGAEAVPAEWLDGTPFQTYVIPGLYLGLVVGGSCLAAAELSLFDAPHARSASLSSAAAMLSWIAVQIAMIGYRS